jgi:hypothetical protein
MSMIPDIGKTAQQSFLIHEVVRQPARFICFTVRLFYLFLENSKKNLKHPVLATRLNSHLWRPMGSHSPRSGESVRGSYDSSGS